MRVLLIKTSSMGDVIHTLPALTDASKAIPGIKFDWMVEESFAEIPAWHPSVANVIPIHFRQWRKKLLAKETRKEWQQLREQMRNQQYDFILDAQGLVKSAFLTFIANGVRVGLDFRSTRETLASLAYQQRCKVNFHQHAIVRMRSLFSQALNYTQPVTLPDYGIDRHQFQTTNNAEKYLVFMHATTWKSKQWPENYWVELARIASAAGYKIKTSGGNADELARAKRLELHCENVEALPRQTIAQMAQLLANACGGVAVDTGFGHLAAALKTPLVSIYGSTNPEFTGTLGETSVALATKFPCSPCLKRTCDYKQPSNVTPACYATLPPAVVWKTLQTRLSV